MNDLLSQTFSARKAGGAYDDLESGPSTQMADLGGGDQKLDGFFADVEKIKADMDKIKQLLLKLQEANEKSKGVHRARAMKALRERMDTNIAQVSQLCEGVFRGQA